MLHLRHASAVLLAAALTSLMPAAAGAQTIINPIGQLQPDLTVTLTASASTIDPYDSLTYTATVRNVGLVAYSDPFRGTNYFNTPASGVAFQHTLPAGVVFGSATADSGFTCSQASGVVTCSGGAIPAAGSATITTRVGAQGSPTTLISRARVDPNHTVAERDETNNSSADVFVTVLPADLAVTLRATPSVYEGEQVSLDVRVSDTNLGEAPSVQAQITLPPGATFDPRMNTGIAAISCTFAAPIVTCPLQRFDWFFNNQDFTIKYTAPHVNRQVSAGVVVDSGHILQEGDERNNTASAFTTVIGLANLVAVTTTHSTVWPLLVERQATVRNDGLGDATNIRWTTEVLAEDNLAQAYDALALVNVNGGGFTCTSAPHPRATLRTVAPYTQRSGQLITCTGGTLAPGQSATLDVTHLLHQLVGTTRSTVTIVDPDQSIRELQESDNRAEDRW